MDAVSMKFRVAIHTLWVGYCPLSPRASNFPAKRVFPSSTLTFERPRRPQREGALQALTK